jgi:hypothetical protein
VGSGLVQIGLAVLAVLALRRRLAEGLTILAY